MFRRMLNPVLWDDPRFGALSLFAKIIYMGLISLADDCGRGRCVAPFVLSKLFPYDRSLTATDVQAALEELRAGGQIVCYRRGGNDYYWVTSWEQDQHIPRPRPSDFPPPPVRGRGRKRLTPPNPQTETNRGLQVPVTAQSGDRSAPLPLVFCSSEEAKEEPPVGNAPASAPTPCPQPEQGQGLQAGSESAPAAQPMTEATPARVQSGEHGGSAPSGDQGGSAFFDKGGSVPSIGKGSKGAVEDAEQQQMRRALDGSDLPPGVKQALGRWAAYKREQRDAYHPSGWQALLQLAGEKCRGGGARGVIDAIEHSMASNWRGIVWEKGKGASPPQPGYTRHNYTPEQLNGLFLSLDELEDPIPADCCLSAGRQTGRAPMDGVGRQPHTP